MLSNFSKYYNFNTKVMDPEHKYNVWIATQSMIPYSGVPPRVAQPVLIKDVEDLKTISDIFKKAC